MRRVRAEAARSRFGDLRQALGKNAGKMPFEAQDKLALFNLGGALSLLAGRDCGRRRNLSR